MYAGIQSMIVMNMKGSKSYGAISPMSGGKRV